MRRSPTCRFDEVWQLEGWLLNTTLALQVLSLLTPMAWDRHCIAKRLQQGSKLDDVETTKGDLSSFNMLCAQSISHDLGTSAVTATLMTLAAPGHGAGAVSTMHPGMHSFLIGVISCSWRSAVPASPPHTFSCTSVFGSGAVTSHTSTTSGRGHCCLSSAILSLCSSFRCFLLSF